MSNAKKCDRCGSFYERPVEPEFDVYKDQHPYPPYKYDLCDNCIDILKAFINSSSETCHPKKRENDYLYDCSKCGGWLPQPPDSSVRPEYCMWCGTKVVY